MFAKFSFQNGRHYNAQGQIIMALVDLADGEAWFFDHSRCIYGHTQVSVLDQDVSCLDLAQAIGRKYDDGQISWHIPVPVQKYLEAMKPSDEAIARHPAEDGLAIIEEDTIPSCVVVEEVAA